MPITKCCRIISSATLRPSVDAWGWRAAQDEIRHGARRLAVYQGITPLLEKPNAYLDFSEQSLQLSPATLSGILREWLEHVPEKVMFATDAYPYSDELGWEESAWISARNGREALGRALTCMLRDGAITPARAVELARMVLRENARALYEL